MSGVAWNPNSPWGEGAGTGQGIQPLLQGLHPPDNGQARDGEHQQWFIAINHLLGQVAQVQGSGDTQTPLQWI